jgi:hypothetical protein
MRSNAWADRVLAALAACALEAAWISLGYTAIGSLASEGPPPLSIVSFGAAAVLGLAFARWAIRRDLRGYGTAVAAVAVVAAFLGWLVPVAAAAADLLADPLSVLEQHPGGLLLGLAFVRGAAHVTPEDDERIAEVALGPGLAGVSFVWILLTATGGTGQPWVMQAAFTATLTYVAAALIGLGLARLTGVPEAATVGADRRTRLVLLGVVLALLVVAIPMSSVLGVSLDEPIRAAVGSGADLLLVLISVLLWPAALLAALLVAAFDFLTGGGPTGQPAPLPDPDDIADQFRDLLRSQPGSFPMLGFLPIVLAAIAAVLLGRAYLRRPATREGDRRVLEVRETERPVALRLPSLRLPRPQRRLVPRTASEAYVASLELLRESPDLARDDAETPAEHGRRLPLDARGIALRRLAADYSLAEFGGRPISRAEHRRAIQRWEQLRRSRS